MSFHSGHMPEEPEEMDPKAKKTSSPRLLTWFVGAIFAGLGGYYLWMQHRAHVLQYWPVAIFLLCPLMHFFGGHGGGHKHGNGQSANEEGGHREARR